MDANANTGTFDYGAQPESANSGVADSLRNAAASIKEKAADLPVTLADKLEAGADAIRPEHVPSTASGAGRLVNETKIARATDSLANNMEAGAEWLRNADLNKMRDSIEQHVKEKPAQSLLIALGVGYLLGKALRQ